MSRAAVLAPAIVLALTACAPSAGRFVRMGRYDEAICAADRFSDDRDADRAVVARALERDLALAIHVHAVTRAELEGSVGPAGARVAERALILNVRTSGARPAILDHEVSVSLTGADAPAGPYGGLPGVGNSPSRELFAALTGERLPEPQTFVTGPLQHPTFHDKVLGSLRGPGPMLAGLLELATLGLLPMTEITGVVRSSSPTVTVTPGPADFLRAAPAAETLQQSFAKAGGKTLVFARPAGEDVAVKVVWQFKSSSFEGPCTLRLATEIPLPPGGSIEERVNRRFGRKMALLADVGRRVQ